MWFGKVSAVEFVGSLVKLGAGCETEDSTLVAFLWLFVAHDEDDWVPSPTYLHKSEQRKGRETSSQQLVGDSLVIKVKELCTVCLGRGGRDGV